MAYELQLDLLSGEHGNINSDRESEIKSLRDIQNSTFILVFFFYTTWSEIDLKQIQFLIIYKSKSK